MGAPPRGARAGCRRRWLRRWLRRRGLRRSLRRLIPRRALPGADEKVSHGRPNFFTRKVFAIYGGVVKGDHDPEPFRQALLVLPDEADRPSLLEDERFVVPGYYGPYGWVMLDLRNPRGADGVDWAEVAELVDASFRRTAPARLVAALDS